MVLSNSKWHGTGVLDMRFSAVGLRVVAAYPGVDLVRHQVGAICTRCQRCASGQGCLRSGCLLSADHGGDGLNSQRHSNENPASSGDNFEGA